MIFFVLMSVLLMACGGIGKKIEKTSIENADVPREQSKAIILKEYQPTNGDAVGIPKPEVIIVRRPQKDSSVPSSTSTDPQRTEGQKPAENRPMELQALVTSIFGKHCVACHSATNVQGNFGNLDNIEALIAEGRYIVPQKPELSLLYLKLAPTGNMPPGGRLTDQEVEIIKEWIIQLSPIARQPIVLSTITTSLIDDLSRISEAERRFVRYLSLQVPYNAQATDQTLELYRLALQKTINSLSNLPEVKELIAIDKAKIIYRLKLNEYGISPELFDATMLNFYPYSLSYPASPTAEISINDIANDQKLKADVGSAFYLLRGDWFAATATLPILYEQLLNQGKNHQDLDTIVGLNRNLNISENKVHRAGFKTSGVSSQNRVIERHPLPSGRFYWLSYDFASVDENIFELPLGPIGTFTSKEFNHDGGEIIYQLPNGLFGYRLVDKNGTVVDKGPTSIVKQNDAPPQFLAAIVNGISCMNCHGAGLLPKSDEVRSFAEINQSKYLPEELEKLKRLYPDNKLTDELILNDNKYYFEALMKIGIDPKKPDPVNQAFRHYNRSLAKADIVAELMTTSEKFDALLSQEPFKSKWWAAFGGGVLSREEFNRLMPLAWQILGRGMVLKGPLLGDFLVTPSCMFANPLQMDQCLINAPPPPATP